MYERHLLSAVVALVCAALGFVLVAQVRTTESLGDRLVIEREEDLARILADLSSQSERLQGEITELRLTLFDFEFSAESEELALRNLERRLEDLAVLTGTVAVEGTGIVLTVEDPEQAITQELMVDVVQELRDAGAEAISVDGHRLLASSSFVTRQDAIQLDRRPISPPYRIAAIGVPATLAGGLEIPGGAVDSLRARSGVEVIMEHRDQLTLPAADTPPTFTYARPVPPDSDDDTR